MVIADTFGRYCEVVRASIRNELKIAQGESSAYKIKYKIWKNHCEKLLIEIQNVDDNNQNLLKKMETISAQLEDSMRENEKIIQKSTQRKKRVRELENDLVVASCEILKLQKYMNNLEFTS